MKLKQINWVAGKHGANYAFVGNNCLGTAMYTMDREAGKDEKYNATANIGNQVWRFKCASLSDAKEVVEETIEQILLAFFE